MRWTRQRSARGIGGRAGSSMARAPVSCHPRADDDAARCEPGWRFTPLASPLRAGPSRVVPMPVAGIKATRRRALQPKRRCQRRPTVTNQSGWIAAGESTKQAGSPPRAERRMYPVLSWWLTRALSTLCAWGCGRTLRPAFRAPSSWGGRSVSRKTRALRAARSRSRIRL